MRNGWTAYSLWSCFQSLQLRLYYGLLITVLTIISISKFEVLALVYRLPQKLKL